MRRRKKLLALAAALALTIQLAPAAMAHDHPGIPPGEPAQPPKQSAWAVEEIRRAGELGLIHGHVATVSSDTADPINREEFCCMAAQYLTVEQDQVLFWELVQQYIIDESGDESLKNPFSDCQYEDVVRPHALGIVEGANGQFAPFREITRQEAATMLARAYHALGGELPAAALTFDDKDKIEDWAAASVAAMAELGVMQGVGENRFDPLSLYTKEQCIATFLRLYEKAPVSRPKGNVEKLFSYEQIMDNLPDGGCHGVDWTGERYEKLRLEGPSAALVQTTQGGGTSFFSTLWLVGRDGSMRIIDPGVCNYSRYIGELTSFTELIDPQFSQGGATLTFTIVLENDVTGDVIQSGGTVLTVPLHQAGSYLCTVDVATGQCVAVRQEAP